MSPRRSVLLLVVFLGGACSTAGGSTENAAVEALAVRAEGVAAAIDAGACQDALAGARSLQADLAATTLEPPVRAEALAGADRLVNSIVCAPATPAPTPTTVTVAEPRRSGDGAVTSPRKRKGHKGDDDD